MPKRSFQPDLTSADRRREVAAILAKAVIRMRKRAASDATSPLPQFPESSKSGLANPAETRPSVVRTHGLCLRDEGDDA